MTSKDIKVGDYVTLSSNALDYTAVSVAPVPEYMTGKSVVYLVVEVGNKSNSEAIKLKSAVTSNGSFNYINTLCKYVGEVKSGARGSGASTTATTKDNDTVATDTSGSSSASDENGSSDGIGDEMRNMFNDAASYNDLRKSYIKASTRLFGMPYQFMSSVDPRVDSISPYLGVEYCRNIVSEAPIITIRPGHPRYLDSNEAKADEITSAYINANSSLSKLNGSISDNQKAAKMGSVKGQLKYYGWKDAYIEFMNYVNLMCRTAAGLLSIESREIDGVKLANFDWKNYRYDRQQYTTGAMEILDYVKTSLVDSMKEWFGDKWEKFKSWVFAQLDEVVGSTSSSDSKKIYSINDTLYDSINGNAAPVSEVTYAESLDGTDKKSFWAQFMDKLEINCNCIQFYIDPSSFNESASNQTDQSTLENLLTNTAGQTLKEFQFIMNSSGASDDGYITKQIEALGGSAVDALLASLNSASSQGGILFNLASRVGNLSTNIIRGDTMIFPQIYTGSSYSKSYSITITLKTPYGNKYSYYMDILVPLFHLIALAMPRQSTANTYSSPFIIKASIPGVFNCSLGIVDSISIEKNITGDGLSVDGYPLEVRVTLNIKDLYTDLMISPSTDPALFVTNSGLMEYLAVNCGIDLSQPNYSEKITTYLDAAINMAKDIPTNLGQSLGQPFNELFQSAGWLTN